MKTYKIISIIDSFEFPLREAQRKQIWWTALDRQKKGYDVSILILSRENQPDLVEEGITIKFIDRKDVKMLRIKSDQIHFINNTISHGLFILFGSKGFKTLTLTDGEILGESKRTFRKILSAFLPLLFHKIQVYTDYQKSSLLFKKAEKILPFLPTIEKDETIQKSETPSILYMGHLSAFKGLDTIINAYKIVLKELPNLKLIIANNMIRGDEEIIKMVNDIHQEYPNNVEIKGIVDPFEELSKAWVYLYPFKNPHGTMAYALSLYESLSCNTPFIACNVGGNAELFDPKFLIEPNDYHEMSKRILLLINERINS